MASGQLVALAAAPVLTRLYGPDDFGSFTVLAAMVAILAVFITLRLELAIPIPRADRTARALFAGGVLASTISCAAAYFVIALFPSAIQGLLPGAKLFPWVWIVPASALFFALYDLSSQYAVRKKQYGLIGKRSFAYNTVTVLSQIALGYSTPGGGLLLGQLIGKGAGVALVAPSAGLLRRPMWPSFRGTEMTRAISEFRRFPLVLAPSAVFNVIGVQGPFILFGVLFGAPVVGALGLVQRVLAAPAAMLGQAAAQVFLGESAGALRSGQRNSLRFFLKSSMLLCAIGIPFFLLVGVIAPVAFPVLFGKDWQSAGSYAQALVPFFCLQFVVAPVSQTLILHGAQGLQLLWDIGRAVMVMGSIVLASSLTLDSLTATWVFSSTAAAAYIVLWLMCLFRLRGARGRAHG